jgi:hypothetical protein|tara:strand:+ start:19 stop:780 length:762 start_codon:yes stop_codon:yes gene_type:complete
MAMKEIKNKILKKLIKKNRPILVAEISANHNGSLVKAKKLIDSAKKYGADLVKLQTYTPDTTALGYHCEDTWYESNTSYATNWTSNKSFIEDMLRVSKDLNEIFIVLRYKNLEWMKLSFFNDLLEQIKKNRNITISNNYNKSFYTYKLCTNSDLIIAKHTSVVDECLSKKIPVLIHDYVHNSNNMFAMTFDYGGSEIVCHNYEELLNRSKIFLENKNNETTKKIEKLHKEFYQTEQHGLVRDKIFNHLNKNLN